MPKSSQKNVKQNNTFKTAYYFFSQSRNLDFLQKVFKILTIGEILRWRCLHTFSPWQIFIKSFFESNAQNYDYEC